MRTLLISFILLLGTALGFAQQIDLSGQISVHNSRYRTGQIEFVSDASVQAPFAGASISDAEGLFDLTFQGIESGTVIKLSVEKAGLEVVNTYDLERVVLGQKPRLLIYLAPKGRLAQAQTDLYNISKEALFARRDALITRLQGEKAESEAVLEELEKDWGIEINSIGEARELLDTKVEELQKRLPEFAQELAAKNLDFASELYIQAYKLFQTGDIQGAIDVLGDVKLEQSYDEALSTASKGKDLEVIGKDLQEKARLQIDQVVESYQLKAEGHILLFEYKGAATTQRKVVEILEATTEEKTIDLADAYKDLGSSLQNLGKYSEALHAHQKALSIIEQDLEPDHPYVATLYNNLAMIYQSLGEYDKALLAIKKSLAIREQVLEPNHPSISTSYNNLSMIYRSLGDYSKALVAIKESLIIQEGFLKPNQPNIANSYSNLAATYESLGDYDKALLAIKESLAIQEQIFETNHPYVATLYNNLAMIYQSLGEYDKALLAIKKSLAIREQVFEANHPSIATSYNNLGMIYQSLGDYGEALFSHRKSLAIKEQILELNHPDIAISHHNLAAIFYYQGQLDSAIRYEKYAYVVWQEKLPEDHPNLETVKYNLAFMYPERAVRWRTQKQYKKAIEDYQLSLKFGEEDGEIYNGIGFCYYYIGNYEHAIKNYETSYRRQGVSETIYLNNTGMAFAKWGKLAEARKRFTELEQLLPDNGLPYRGWGLFYTIEGELNTALENFEKAIELGYDNWEWFRTEESLDALRESPRFKALLEKAPVQNE